ncbi:MAG: dTMP kinase [Dehalococcoidia bacterium]
MFVTFEGGEGSGKSTQARVLAERLQATARGVTLTREPGGTPLGEAVRSLVLHRAAGEGGPAVDVGDTAELLLFAASRAQLVETVIRPALARGDVVVCDRFTDSTVAYQGFGRGISLDVVARANVIATQGLIPDITVLLDLPAELGLARRLGERAADQIEREALAFHTRVREGFLALAGAEPHRFLVVDGTRPPGVIADEIRRQITSLLERQR